MEKERNYESQIDAYLLGELLGAERSEFEQALAQDPELAQQVEEQRLLMEGLQFHGNEQLRARLKNIHQQAETTATETSEKTNAKVRRFPLRTLLTAAATLALLIIATLLLRTGPASGPEIFAQHYDAYSLSLTNRSEPGVDENLAQIDELYAQGNYEAILPLVRQVLPTRPNDPLLKMAGGIAALESKQYQEAIRYFQAIRQEPDSPLADQATWYLALTHLRQDSKNLARHLLEKLASRPDADRHQEAQQVLEEL